MARLRATPAAIAALLLGACATTAREPWVLTAAAVRDLPVAHREPISTYPQALGALRSFPEWIEHSRGEAGPVLPDYALVAVDGLIEQHGVPAVLCYFELFSTRQQPEANFVEAFGESEEQFEERLHEILGRW